MRLDTSKKATPLQYAFLIGLCALAGYLFFFNNGEDSGTATTPTPATTPAPAQPAPSPVPRPARPQRAATAVSTEPKAFRPSMKLAENIDPLQVDPTLRTDLLDRVRNVPVTLTGRNLFELGTPPPPPVARVKPPKVKIEVAVAQPVQQAPVGPAPPPPPPPIPLKFFGYIAPERNGPKRAFLAEGEDVFVASEGDLIRKRYKVVRINLSSIVMQDVNTNSQQTLPLVEEQRES